MASLKFPGTPLAGLLLLTVALASHAQQPWASAAQGRQAEWPGGQRVASPNRTPSRTWAAPDKRLKVTHHGGKPASSGSAALAWVDATGKVIGKAVTSNAMLVPYQNELAVLLGLESDQVCDARQVCTYRSGGTRWSAFYSIYYASADCTGAPYLPYAGQGAPYSGVPVVDEGNTYLYLFRVTDSTRVTVHSAYVNNTCNTVPGSLALDAAPVTEVVPAATYGSAPYFLR